MMLTCPVLNDFKEAVALRYEHGRRESFYLSFGSINDVLHVDGVFALVFALLLVFLLEYPFFADAEAAG